MANVLEESYERGKKSMPKKAGESKKDKAADKEIRRVVIEETDNDAFVVTCEYESKDHMMMGEEKELAFSSWDKAASYLDDLFAE